MKPTMSDPNVSRFHLGSFHEFYSEEFNYTDMINLTDFDVDKTTVPCHHIPIAEAINIAVCIFQVFIFLLAIPGNLIVGVVITSHRHLLSPSDVYLFNLTVADVLLAFTLPFYATQVVCGWVFSNITCKVVSLGKEISVYTSILFLVCISVDRYMAVVWAMEAQKAKRMLCSLVVSSTVWILGFLISLPALYNEAFYNHESQTLLCAEKFDMNNADEWRLATRVMRHLLGFMLPLGIMLVCYSVTIARLLRTNFQHQRAMKVIIAVVVAFLLCWMPFHLATIIDTLLRAKLLDHSCMMRNAVDIAMFATQNLGLLHCCINPVLYAFLGGKFRKRFIDLLYKSGALERGSISRSTRSTSQSSDGNFL